MFALAAGTKGELGTGGSCRRILAPGISEDSPGLGFGRVGAAAEFLFSA